MNIRKNVDYSSMFSKMDAAMQSNLPQMELYCELGRLINSRPEKGAAVAAADYLTAQYPSMAGFSPRNMRRMRDFYRMYGENSGVLSKAMRIGWTQNVVILEAKLSMEERCWYLSAADQFGWSKAELLRAIDCSVHLELILDEKRLLCYNKNKPLTHYEHGRDAFHHPRQIVQAPISRISDEKEMVGISSAKRRAMLMDSEMLGVTIVERAIAKSDYLVSNISRYDREPSWDGYVEVYNKASNNHSKSDLFEKVPVQVKAHKEDDLDRASISYSVDVADIRNYLNAGGTVFFVVYVDSEGESDQIYYEEFLPFELKQMLELCGKEQKKKTIKLKRFPSQKTEISNVFLNFARNMRKQKQAIFAESVTVESLAKDGNLRGISFGYIDINQDNIKPFDYFFNHGTYLYAKLPYNVELPVMHMPNVEAAMTTIQASVCAGNKEFYSSYNLTFKKDSMTLSIGKSVEFVIDHINRKSNFSYKLQGNLSERINDLSFLIAALESRSFTVNGVEASLKGVTQQEDASFHLEEWRKELDTLVKIKNVLDNLKVSVELDMDKLTEHDIECLYLLITGIRDKKPVPLADANSPVGRFRVGNLIILIAAIKEQNSNLFKIYNFFGAPLVIRGVNADGSEYDSSIYLALKKGDFLEVSNIDYDEILRGITETEISPNYAGQVVALGLQMLLAFDMAEKKAPQLINLSRDIFEWLKENDTSTPAVLHDLNLLQIAKRLGDLTESEVEQLQEIVEDPNSKEDVLAAAYLLMDNQAAAEKHFRKMDSVQQDAFVQYPIYHFWKSSNSM